MYFIDAYTIYTHILYRYICHIDLCVLHIPLFIRHFIALCSAFCAAHYLSLAPSCFVLYCCSCCCCFVASALFAYQLKMRPVNVWQFVNRHSAPPPPLSLNLTLINVATLFFFVFWRHSKLSEHVAIVAPTNTNTSLPQVADKTA